MQMRDLINNHIKVLDDIGFVELIDMMPHPDTYQLADQSVVSAARVSRLGESKGAEADERLLRYMLRNGHTSPFEHVQFTFRVNAPLMVWWQWARHRTMSYNAQSGRYTPFEETDMYKPSRWRAQASTNKQSSEGYVAEADEKWLDEALDLHYQQGFNLYQNALDAGVSKELARVFLPGFSMYYTWVVSVNALNLMKFLKLRTAPDAQYEIRAYAWAIYAKIFKEAMSWTATAFVDYWLDGKEPEEPHA